MKTTPPSNAEQTVSASERPQPATATLKELFNKKYKKYFILNNYRKYLKMKFAKRRRYTYSQSGEDVIIDFIFTAFLKMEKPTYLDLGAHHSSIMSNTVFFYKKGARGVLVEADPFLFEELKRNRRKDLCLNIGVGVTGEKEADFYILDAKALNTFSKEEVEKCRAYTKVEKIIKMPLLSINEIIEKHCLKTPDFISIDIEGLDFEVIKGLNFDKYRPKVFCVETIENSTEHKNKEIDQFMLDKGYMVYADTYINTIYVDKGLRDIWKK